PGADESIFERTSLGGGKRQSASDEERCGHERGDERFWHDVPSPLGFGSGSYTEKERPMTGRVPATAAVALVIGYLAGLAGGKTGVAAQQPPAQTAPPACASIQVARNQGAVAHGPAADLQKAHAALAARSNGRILSKPRDLVPLPMTRTHMFDVVHRPQTAGDATAEQHEGVTDLYVILGGSGRLTVGGEITNRQVIPNR